MMEDWRTNAIQVGGILGAGVVGALIAVLANATYRGGADAGDWLQFFGGMIGAALAVFGAVYFERKRRREDASQRLKRIHGFLIDANQFIKGLDKATPKKEEDWQEHKAFMSHVIDRIEVMIKYLDGIPFDEISRVDTLRYIHWFRNDLATWLRFAKDLHDNDSKIKNSQARESTYGWPEIILNSASKCLVAIIKHRIEQNKMWRNDERLKLPKQIGN